MRKNTAFTRPETVNPFKALPPESPVHFLGEDFTVKVIHKKYYRRDDHFKGVSESADTVYSQTFNALDIGKISGLLNK